MLLSMRVLSTLPDVPSPTRQSDTDYAKFLDGQVWEITEADVPMPLYKLRATLISKARRAGVKLISRLHNQSLYVHAERTRR